MKLLLLCLLGAVCLSAADDYEGYKVFRMWPETEEQRQFIKSLEDNENLDFWADVKQIDLPVDIMVKPEDQTWFVAEMNNIGLEVSVFMEDVAENIREQKVDALSRSGRMTWTAYYTLNDINAWLDTLATQYPSQVSVVVGGSTFEGRQIRGVKISFGSGRKAVFLEGGIHAREWVSPATMTYVINELLTSSDASLRKVANSFDWYIFPVANPDGYVFSHTTTRLWRKTRTVYAGTCRGADPNRNWDAHWGQAGTSTQCSSDTFGGPRPFSEISTESLSRYIRSVAPDMVAYISFHSYSQLLMVPYGHTTAPLDNYSETVAIGRVAAAALERRYGTQYRVGNIAETIYMASGGSIDWVKQEFRTPLVYIYELRDRGQFGFLLPANQIIPNSEETVDSIVAIFEEADRMGIVSLL